VVPPETPAVRGRSWPHFPSINSFAGADAAARSEMEPTRHGCWPARQRVMVGPVVMLVVILLFVGFLPTWPYSQDWGVGPSAILLLVLVVLLGVTLNGRL